MDSKWEFDKFYEDTYELARSAEVSKFTTFLQVYSKQLSVIEDGIAQAPYIHWDFDSSVIDIDLITYEHSTIIELVKTDNKVLNKLVIVFTALCSEIEFLIKEGENKYFNGLLYYGEGKFASPEDGEAQIQMGRFLSLFQELSCYVKRCYQVIKCCIQQLSIFYSPQKAAFKIDAGELHLEMVFSSIGSLLRVLISLDTIIKQQVHLKDDWNNYKKVVKSVHHNPSKFNFDMTKFKRFETQLIELEAQLLDGNIFQRCIEQIYDEKGNFVSKITSFADEFAFTIKQMFDSIESQLGDGADAIICLKFVSVCALYVLFYQIFRNFDKKLFKSIWDSYKKMPAVYLTGSCIWYSNDFLLEKLPNIAKAIDKKAEITTQNIRSQYLQQRIQSLSKNTKDTQQFYLNVAMWMSKMDALNDINQEKAFAISDLLLKGHDYANEIAYLFTMLTNMSVSLKKNMTKSSVLSLCHLIELSKAIQMTYYKKKECLVNAVQYILQGLGNRLLLILQAAKKRLMSDKKYSEKRLDILSGLVLTINALNGPVTRERLLIAKIGLAISNRAKTFKDDENVFELLNKIEKIANLTSRISKTCDCRFLYWQQSVFLPIYLDDLYENVNSPNKIHYFIWALRDCINPMKYTRHDNSDKLIDNYLDDLINTLKTNFLDKLCIEIEKDLRLSIHLHLKLDERKPFKDGIKDLSKFVHIMPIRIHDRCIDIKAYVEEYLDKTFYNLTTIALYDWRTYSEMRNLAEQKYRLKLSDPHLPTQTLEQGSDVLEIMRTINVFVTKYLYNLNNQIFVEKSSNNKHLNTINIRHIANSIRTHGIGIMNTTVNYTYQYLRKQFFIFSQFLYDEHIKAKLIKDIGFFKENKATLEQKYPYDKAEKFNRSIRKLGVLEDNQTYMDQFRCLITYIGNAMGYVRMIRSGGLRCCSNAIRFVPDLDDIVNFEQYTTDAKLSAETIVASKNLNTILNNLVKNFTEGSEYFKILVDVFSPEFCSSKNMHLRNFYIILPALTLNFVEHMIGCKEKLSKKNNTGAAFTDDGFAMGVAYILKLLNQYSDFDSLHWFQSVREKFRTNKSTIIEQQKTGQSDDKLMQTQVLTMQRYDTYLKEFELLQYSLSSARIFFRAESNSAANANTDTSNTSTQQTTTTTATTTTNVNASNT